MLELMIGSKRRTQVPLMAAAAPPQMRLRNPQLASDGRAEDCASIAAVERSTSRPWPARLIGWPRAADRTA